MAARRRAALRPHAFAVFDATNLVVSVALDPQGAIRDARAALSGDARPLTPWPVLRDRLGLVLCRVSLGASQRTPGQFDPTAEPFSEWPGLPGSRGGACGTCDGAGVVPPARACPDCGGSGRERDARARLGLS